jgi:hypothetical protein
MQDLVGCTVQQQQQLPDTGAGTAAVTATDAAAAAPTAAVTTAVAAVTTAVVAVLPCTFASPAPVQQAAPPGCQQTGKASVPGTCTQVSGVTAKRSCSRLVLVCCTALQCCQCSC